MIREQRIRNLRSVALALVAVFAMSAMAASSASAAKVTAANGLAQHLVASDVGAADKFEISGSTITCSGETLTANMSAGQQTELALLPNYINCKTEGAAFNNVTFTIKECYTKWTTTPQRQLHQLCTWDIHHYSDALHKNRTCSQTVPAQTYVGESNYTNVGNHVEVHGVAEGTLETHGSCSFGFTLNQKFTYTYSLTITATSGAAIHVK